MGGSLTLRQKCRYLRAAKEAFNKPKADGRESGLPSSPVKSPVQEKESPVVIIQPRSRPPLFSSLGAKPKEYMIRFLESALDVVGAAATATGMSADVQAESASTAEQPATKANRADDALEAVELAVRYP
eukprot:symbB.v1.2.038415.t1/scaffold5970.1/size22045/2